MGVQQSLNVKEHGLQDSRKAESGEWHRMTTQDEIDASNAFLEELLSEKWQSRIDIQLKVE